MNTSINPIHHRRFEINVKITDVVATANPLQIKAVDNTAQEFPTTEYYVAVN